MTANIFTEVFPKKCIITLVTLLFTGAVFAQKAELNLILTKPDLAAVAGTVNITGTDTTISDNAFISPKTYILKTVTGIDNAFANGEGFVILPNPTPDGNVIIQFDPLVYEGAVMHVYSPDGRFLGRTDIEDGNTLNITAGKVMLLLKISDRKHTYTHKIVTMGEGLNAILLSAGNTSKGITQKSSTASDAYTLIYSDPTSNLNTYNETFSVTPGNTFKIEKNLDWTEKNVMYSASTNTNTKIVATDINSTVLDEKTTSTGTLSTQTITNKFDNTKGLSIDFKLMSPFTDTVTITRNLFKNEEAVIDTLRNGWFYLTVTGNGSNYTVKSGTQTIANALVGEQILFKKQGDQTALELIVTKAGYTAKTVNINMNKGIRSEAIILDPATYSHTLTGLLLSSLSGKTIKDGTQIYIVNTATPTDTLWVSSVSGAIPSTTWYDNSQTETIKVGSRAVPGHQPNSITFLMDDNETKNITFTGLVYSLTQPILLQNQYSEAVENATIAGGDAGITTGADGKATITKSNLTTDANNVAYSSYTLLLSISGANIQSKTVSVNSTAGTNSQIILSVVQEYTQWLTGYVWTGLNINTEDPLLNVWKDGIAVQTATVTDYWGAYETNRVSRTTKTFIPDSITVSHDGYYTYKNTEFIMNEGANNLNVQLLKIYYFYIYGTNTSPDGTKVHAWKDGETVLSATVANKAYQTNSIKAATETFILDSLIYSKEGYISLKENNVTLNEGGNAKEVTLTKKIIEFYIRLFDINGDKVTDLTQTIEWADGTTSTLTPNANGIIHVYKEMFVTSETADISNGSVKYSQNFMVFRKRTEEITNPADTNYAQVSRFNGVVDFARLQLTNIPDTLYEYVAKAKVKTPDALVATYGDSIPIIHPVVLDMMGGDNAGTIKFIPRAGAEKLYMFQMTFNETTGAPIEQTQLDRAKAELDKVLAIYTLNNGVKLFDYEFTLINSYTDAKWLEAQARDNYDNMAYTKFWSGNAYNGAGKTLTYSTNGKLRIKASFSEFNTGNTTGQIYEEIYQQFTNNKDPAQGTAVWVTTTTGEVTEFAKTFARIDYLFNQGTPTN